MSPNAMATFRSRLNAAITTSENLRFPPAMRIDRAVATQNAKAVAEGLKLARKIFDEVLVEDATPEPKTQRQWWQEKA
jgi:hypothetical protein